MAERSRNRQGCGQPTTVRNIADNRQSGGKQVRQGPAASTTQTRRLVATGSGDKPQLRCLVVTYARVRFLHLHGSPDTLASRIGARTDHFMPSLAADPQMETFEPLTADEGGVSVDIEGTPTEIAQRALLALDLTPPTASP
jgi:gluconate kinase